jgi:hypothetical protein
VHSWFANAIETGKRHALAHGDPTPPPENAYPTPAQFVWLYLHEPYDRQLSRAKVILEQVEAAFICLQMDHAGAVLNNQVAEGLVNHYRAALTEIANYGSLQTNNYQAIARKALGQPG